MKLFKSIIIAILVSILFVGCSKSSEVLQSDISITEEIEENDSKNILIEDVEIDLTKLSSTMVYAEVYNIVTNPSEYIGKTIKMSGAYKTSYSEATGSNYHFVVIADATACCSSGIEFIINDKDIVYPDLDENIEVIGVFDSYEELGSTYYYLNVYKINKI